VLRIIVFDPDSKKGTPYLFQAEWRAEGERRTHGVVRARTGHAEPGAVIGTMTADWHSFSDGLGRIPLLGDLLAVSTRRVLEQVGDPDPASDLSEISIEIDEIDGRSINVRSAKADGRPDLWSLTGRPADWWTRIVVFRDGVPTPSEFRQE
jgi:hypothetical protein